MRVRADRVKSISSATVKSNMSSAWQVLSLFMLTAMSFVSCKKKSVESANAPLVIVGASAAGVAAVKDLLERNYSGEVVWIADQHEDPYSKTKIPYLLEGSKTLDEISIFDMKSLPSNVTPMFGKRVVQIKPDEHVIELNDGQSISYQRLLLAIGLQYQIPSAFAAQKINGIFMFGRASDIQAIEAYLQEHEVKNAVVVGFGLTGADTIDGLVQRGIKVGIVQRSKRLLDRYVNDEAEKIIRDDLDENGVQIHAPSTIKSIISDTDGYVQSIVLSNGNQLACDMIIFTTGLVLQEKLLSDAGIKIQDDGIVVNQSMQTSNPDIFAAGDCALITDLVTGKLRRSAKWPEAEAQGAVAAQNMCGASAIYKGSPFIFGVRFLDTLAMSCGPIGQSDSENFQKVIKRTDKSYSLLLLEKNILKGFLLVNPKDRGIVQKLRQLIEDHTVVTVKELEDLL